MKWTSGSGSGPLLPAMLRGACLLSQALLLAAVML